MNPTQILLMTAELLGGLAFFLYGMNAMSGGLEQMAGGKLERTLRKVTSKGFLSFFLGAGITIVIQSSSAMTVMLVGLVAAHRRGGVLRGHHRLCRYFQHDHGFPCRHHADRVDLDFKRDQRR